ncbi:hypothetical protein CQ052_15030 [Ochrobactrum sp. MYb15]|nr:hypothetical protein CQZ90_08155 [Ochrobactrum sp. MYb19]PRA55524.1 hypothetical protein CQ062_11735 [Ochrobactrum sp. MYb68]PRA68594.1 hypothetical protein CQ053_03145 [Ochrobactrum sp. MYb18]PRA74178.1 hypothetical protein CQ049_12935 [Brucella thiophenivorans]PRA90846.1 hypothetical protein CQ051_13050 [Ochrobactrum sp. MYb14]PRA96297.1 hypothetical protein CQ052_15030 [Ochrobactrum sp. MYb15]
MFVAGRGAASTGRSIRAAAISLCCGTVKSSRAFPVFLESLEMLYLFVFSHYPTQNRFALLLEML